MSEDEGSPDKLLARWSRRKQEAKANATLPETAMHDDVHSAPPPAVKDEDIDLSRLPSIDSITSASDIKAFLRKGIPQELTRAALRRAWSADPAIRNFVGLAENAWDFNDPTAMPGFGPLDCSEGELAALVERIVGGLRKSAEALPEVTDSSRELSRDEAPSGEVVAQAAVTAEPAPGFAAAQSTVAGSSESNSEPARRRTHGSALPR